MKYFVELSVCEKLYDILEKLCPKRYRYFLLVNNNFLFFWQVNRKNSLNETLYTASAYHGLLIRLSLKDGQMIVRSILELSWEYVFKIVYQSYTAESMGWYERAPIAVLRQAKFYLPRQASVPKSVHEAPQYTRYSFIPLALRIVYCGSYMF